MLGAVKKLAKRECFISVDTDVNGCAMGEFILAKTPTPRRSLAYITIGTGVGVGLVVNDAPVHGLVHPEGGHIP